PQSGRIRALSPLRRNNPDQARELGMSHGVHRPVPDLGARRVLPKEVFTLPVLRRPDRPRDESPAAVGADVIEDIFNARRAERTFVSANARVQRVGRQRLVTVFARWPQFQHGARYLLLTSPARSF